MRQHRLFILVWIITSMLAGCDEDTNAPRIIARVPDDGTTFGQRAGQPGNPLIKLQFNEALLGSSIPNDALIMEYNGEALPGDFQFSPTINTLAFEPEEPLLFLRKYTVKLKPGVSDLEGNSRPAHNDPKDEQKDEWSFRMRDGAFSSTNLVEASNGVATEPQITLGADYDGQFIWSQVSNVDHDNDSSSPNPTPLVPRNSIWARTLKVNLLDSPVLIESDNTGDAKAPQVAVDAEGFATAVWSQSDGANWTIRANRFTPDDEEADPQDSNITGTWGIATAVTITIASPGVVSWPGHGLVNDRQVILKTTGMLPTGLTANTTYYVRNATANSFELSATPGSGGASINTSGTQSGIHTATAIASSEIISNAGSDATVPQIAVGPNGNAIAVWVQTDGRVYANRYDDAGSNWEGAAAIDADTGTPTAPQIVIDSGNNAIAVWAQNDRIYANRFTGTWGGAAPIDDGTGTATATPDIAVDGDGNDAIVVWSQSDGTRTSIWANRFASNAWVGPEEIEDLDDGDANEPQVAMNAAGTAITTWSQYADIDTPAAITITINSPGVVNWTAHGLADGREVILQTTGSLPTGLTAGATYYVRNAETNSFQLSATPGGAPIDTSGSQSGTHTATAPRSRIFVSHFTPGTGTWEAPISIDDFDPQLFIPEIFKAGISSEPQITIDGDGNALATWTISMNAGTPTEIDFIGLSRYRGPVAAAALRGWSKAQIFDSTALTFGDSGRPQLAVFPDFTAVTTWVKETEVDRETVTISIGSPAVVTWTAHGLENDSKVVLITTDELPTGLISGGAYYVRNATANSFELAATPGGASIDTSGDQDGTHTAIAFVKSIQANYFF